MKTRNSLVLVFALLLPLIAGRASAADDNWRNLSPKEKDRVQRNYQRWRSVQDEIFKTLMNATGRGGRDGEDKPSDVSHQ